MLNNKDFFTELQSRGLFEYGSNIPTDLVRSLLGIEYPEVATKATFDQLALQELNAIDYCRNVLLGQGKYLSGSKNGYRILLPSENAKQVELYVQQADNKLRRALRLNRSSPCQVKSERSQTEAKIHLKQTSRRAQF